jgi:2-dehydro-3-deoxygluconokinase
MPELLSLGEPLVEFNQPKGGGDWRQTLGGDTSNAAVAAARQGASVGYLSRVGGDAFGEMLLDLWSAEGVDAATVEVDRTAPTGIYFVTHGPAGHRFAYRREGSAASRMTPAWLPRAPIEGARILHLSAISQAISASACDTSFAAIEVARAAGVAVSYDTNLRLSLWPLARARAIIEATLKLCDIALPGYDDLREITGLDDAEAMCDRLLDLGAGIVALTLGSEGVVVATGERRERLKPHQVDAVDATGAGDAFDGGFLAEYLASGDPFRAAAYGNAAAALSVTGYGAIPPIPRRAAVEAFLKERG